MGLASVVGGECAWWASVVEEYREAAAPARVLSALGQCAALRSVHMGFGYRWDRAMSPVRMSICRGLGL